MHQPMTVRVEIRGGRAALVTVAGDVDEGAATRLEGLVDLADTGLDLVVDLSGVMSIDPPGIRVLTRVRDACMTSGGSLLIRRPSSVVRQELHGTTAGSGWTIVNLPMARPRRRGTRGQMAVTI